MPDMLIRMAEDAAREWGRQLRAHCYVGVNTLTSNDSIQRARDGLLDFSSVRAVKQRWDECLVGDALDVSRAIHRFPMMPDHLHEALFIRWVIPGKIAWKLRIANKERRSYYETLGRAHSFLAARLTLNVPRETLCAHESA